MTPRTQPTHAAPRSTRAGHRRRTRPAVRHAVLSAISFTLLLAIAAAGLAGYEYRKLAGQIKHVVALQTKDPNIRHAAAQLNAENFLVIGSDSRGGNNSLTHDVAGARSDTTILIHLSRNRQHVTVVSIPRDSWVRVPACTTINNDFAKQGTVYAAHDDLFNSAFAIGGAPCTVKTIQEITGIAITHYLNIDFAGFQSIVNALGTVTICSPTAAYDANTKLTLKAGENRLNGLDALHYVRARESFGDGSDLGRIKRQQQFLGAVLRQALSGSLLSNPISLTDFLDAVTHAITTDPGTTLGDLRTLGQSMSGLNPKRVVFYTAPIANPDYSPPGTGQTGKVLLDPVKGRVLYDSMINDTAGTPAAAPRPASSAARSTGPSSSSDVPKPNSNAGQQTCAL